MAAALVAAMALAGCGPKETTPPPPTVGVADMEQLEHAHYRYSDYFRLQQEYRNLLAEYDAERADLIARSAAAQQQLAARLDAGDRAAALDEEYRSRLTVRQDEWNARLQARLQEWRQQEQGTVPSASSAADLEAVNLQLKLRALPLDEPQRAAMEARLADILAARGGVEWEPSLSAAAQADLTALKAQAEADLAQYASEVQAQLLTRRDEMAAQMAREAQASLLPDGDVWQAQWHERLAAKEAEIAALRQTMRADIARAARAVAEEKGLEIVFSEYRTNVGAVDITAAMTARMATSSQGGTEREK